MMWWIAGAVVAGFAVGVVVMYVAVMMGLRGMFR